MNYIKVFCILSLLITIPSILIAQKVKYSYIEQKKFNEEIKVEFQNDRIIIQVEIDGNTYSFLVDTGAPTVLDNEIVGKLNLTREKVVEAGSSGTQKDSLGIYILPALKINGIQFNNTVLSNADLSRINNCQEIDGILGANLMALCIWQIDIQKKKIIISDNLKSFSYLENKTKMELYGKQKSPLVLGVVNNKVEELVLFDTGDPALFSWRKPAYEIGLNSKAVIDAQVYRTFGSPYGTLFGNEPNDTINYVFLKKLEIGSRLIESVFTQVSNDNVSKFGVEFLESYIVTLDFPKKRFYSYEYKRLELNENQFIGFGYTIRDRKVFIDEIPLFENDIHINDEVLGLNGISINDFSDECDLRTFLSKNWTKSNTLIKVKLQNGSIIESKVKYDK